MKYNIVTRKTMQVYLIYLRCRRMSTISLSTWRNLYR